MRIAIDARLNSYRAGGISQYTGHLLRALEACLGPEDRVIQIVHRKPLQVPVATGQHFEQRRVWTPPHHRHEQRLLPLELRRLGADVIHYPDFIPLFDLPVPAVITVHDLAFLRYAEILDDQARRYYSQIGRAVHRSRMIIAVSHSTRTDLIELLHVDPARIEVIPEAAAPSFRPLELPPGAAREINGQTLTAGDFALFVGTVEPRKNLATLLHALRALLDARDAAMDVPRLVVAGARGWLDTPIYELVRELRLAAHVMFLGSVDAEDLVWLYNACRLYVHPELYSGFGLPVLEAMQCGAPALVAHTSSLPEIAEDAALMLPPEDAAAWSAAWNTAWDDDELRRRLSHAGVARAARYGWDATARQTLEVYRRAARASNAARRRSGA